MQTINVVEAKSRFSELLSRAASGERFLIQRRERAVAVLLGHEELSRLEQAAQMARHLALTLGQDEALLMEIEDRKLHAAMAAFGLWRDEVELARLAEDIAHERQEMNGREVYFENSG
ncbi:MAG: type II toxin-antitoxin system Phd/YefM family antitoxin [Anaerolineales bacterium]|nr:type II toxin-antitoxin system Phd/YefM family antitoxin [Anaerolineales bacterium]MCB8954802.1 type II toxin-antitoxin system Phd/YefM family antitoxin [Ardenticatenales bacterium]